MADDMGYECLKCNGSLDYQTPQLDALAANGLRFEHCYSQPICTPSRVKLMTGQSNKRNYVRFGKLDRQLTTFGNIFQEAGYKTCIAGKWQLGNEEDSPQHFGFEQSLLWQHRRKRTDNQQHDTRFPNPRLELNGKEVDYNNGEYSSDVFVDFIGKFMEQNRNEPFLVYYPMVLVHCPFSATPDSEDWDPKSRGSKTYKGDPKYFADMVAYADKSVGKLNAKLTELGLRENTLLIFVGDNGTDTPIVTNTTYGKVIGAKGKMIDGGNRVPCVISWPSVIQKGRVLQDIIDFSDFVPTICEATGVAIPKRLKIDGQSFLTQLQGKPGTPRDSIYMWYSRNGGLARAKAFARNQRYKLYEDGRFYDVPKDRLEKKPLEEATLDKKAQAVKQVLQARLDSFADVKRTGRK
jgi:arylsulfatase A